MMTYQSRGHPRCDILRIQSDNLKQTLIPTGQGLSSAQLSLDALGKTFAREATNFTTLASMMAGGLAYRLGKMAGLQIFSRLIPGVFAPLVGLSAEVMAFQGTDRLLQGFQSDNQNSNLFRWNGEGGFFEDCRNSFVDFGMMKGVGHLLRSSNVIFQHLSQDLSMVAGHQATAFLHFTSRPEGNFIDQMLHAEMTNLQLGVGNHLGALMTGHCLQQMERHLEQGLTLQHPTENFFGDFHAKESFLPLRMSSTHSSVLDECVARHREKVLRLTSPFYERHVPERFALFCYTLEYLQNTFSSPHSENSLRDILAYVEYRHLADPLRAREAFEQQTMLQYIEALRKEAGDYSYYTHIIGAVWVVSNYMANLVAADPATWGLHEWNADFSFLMHRVNCYLAARARDPQSDLSSMTEITRQSLEEEGVSLADLKDAQPVLVTSASNTLMLLDFIFRNLIYRFPETLEPYASFLERDFPSHHSSFERLRHASPETVSWEEIERLRSSLLPALPTGEKPRILIVGIGQEWNQARRYLERGYHVVLLDFSKTVGSAYREAQAELESFAAEQGVSVSFHCENITQPSEEFLDRYRGRIDSIEYQYVNGSYGEDRDVLRALLKEKGVFVEFFPFPIHREDLISMGFREVFRRRQVGRVLGTYSEHSAYPIGCHVAIFQ